MAVLIHSIESIEIHRQKRNNIEKNTPKTHIHRKNIDNTSNSLANEARWAFRCFVYNTNKITDPF